MTAPADELRIVPVIMRARSEARNAAALAVSEVRGDTLSIVPSARLAVAWSLVMFILLATTSVVSWMVRVSGFAAVRRQTTLTPAGPSSMAMVRVRFSTAPKAAPMPDVPGPCGRAGLPVRKTITPEPCLSICRAALRAVMNWDCSTVSTASMNSPIGTSAAGLQYYRRRVTARCGKGGSVSIELIDRARSGDEAAFEQLVGPYRREMQVHCYRVLGSVADAEDALQRDSDGRLAGARRLRRTSVDPDLAVPHRHYSVPEHAALG